MLRTDYDCRECSATATQLCALLGAKDKIVINGRFGRLGKRIAEFLDLGVSARINGTMQFWHVLATGQYSGRSFVWRLRPELIEALKLLGHLDEEERLFADEIVECAELREGAKKIVTVNAFERNRTASRLCLEHYGVRCQVCDLDFERRYGDVGKGFAHVHHIRELAEIGIEYKVHPVRDLRPVCPNCHAMLHRRRPAFTIEELRRRLQP
jgi:predicted HNH restriction endonuclease